MANPYRASVTPKNARTLAKQLLALADEIDPQCSPVSQANGFGTFIVTREEPTLRATHRHSSLASAQAEASRLAGTVHLVGDFSVWQQLGTVRTYQPPRQINWTEAYGQITDRSSTCEPDDIPF